MKKSYVRIDKQRTELLSGVPCFVSSTVFRETGSTVLVYVSDGIICADFSDEKLEGAVDAAIGKFGYRKHTS